MVRANDDGLQKGQSPWPETLVEAPETARLFPVDLFETGRCFNRDPHKFADQRLFGFRRKPEGRAVGPCRGGS